MRKFVRGFIGFTFVLMILIVLAYAFIIKTGADIVVKENDSRIEARELIGKQFIVDGDTLTIVNFKYNPLGSSYSIKGGEEYAEEFVQKNLIK